MNVSLSTTHSLLLVPLIEYPHGAVYIYKMSSWQVLDVPTRGGFDEEVRLLSRCRHPNVRGPIFECRSVTNVSAV